MKILITGANGRIGVELANRLSKSHNLVLTSLQEKPAKKVENEKYIQADLANREEIRNLLDISRPEVVIHLAGIMGQICEENHELADKLNVEVTKNLAELATEFKVKKFIFSSSASVYPQNLNRPLKEEDANPQNYYGKTKLKAEQELENIARSSDMKVVILRLFNIYGDGFDDSLVAKLINSQNISNPIPLYNPGNFTRDYIHIDDVVVAFELAITNKGVEKYEVFNIGTGVGLSTFDLVCLLEKRRIKPNVEIAKSNSGATHVVGDMTSTDNRFGFVAKMKIEEFISSQEHSL